MWIAVTYSSGLWRNAQDGSTALLAAIFPVQTPRGRYGEDYLFRYKAAVEAVAPADVLAAARRRLHPGGAGGCGGRGRPQRAPRA